MEIVGLAVGYVGAQMGPMEKQPEASAHKYPAPFQHSTDEHDFEFLPDGVHRYDAILAMIEKAERSIDAFYYMFQNDPAGKFVRDALVKAQKRGVQVCLIVDRFGTDAREAFFRPLVDAGGKFAFFNARWNIRYLIRNHQKMLIVDRKTAVVGGFNVSQHYFQPPEENGWSDMGAVVRGPVVDCLCRWFAMISDWAVDPKAQYRAIRTMVRDWDPGESKVRLLVGGPTRAASNWARQVKRDFARAERLDLAMAYFSPPRSFRRLIRRIAERGRARLIMAGKSDNGATIGASRALYGSMLRSGAKIYEFQPSKLHMKMIVVDDIVYFGSANFDHRSIRVNLEMMIRVKDAALADRMREYLDTMVEDSIEVTRALHRKRRGLLAQLQWWLGWFLVTTLDYTVSRRLNAGL